DAARAGLRRPPGLPRRPEHAAGQPVRHRGGRCRGGRTPGRRARPRAAARRRRHGPADARPERHRRDRSRRRRRAGPRRARPHDVRGRRERVRRHACRRPRLPAQGGRTGRHRPRHLRGRRRRAHPRPGSGAPGGRLLQHGRAVAGAGGERRPGVPGADRARAGGPRTGRRRAQQRADRGGAVPVAQDRPQQRVGDLRQAAGGRAGRGDRPGPRRRARSL
ncbi:MAG: Regulatory protein, LuxR:Response regulator receiver, partial [uncultured Frankineae bacterium]